MTDSPISGATAPPIRFALPPGRGNVLMPPGPGRDGGVGGEYLFRGRSLRLETDGDGTTLFPTDVGVSLLAALNHDAVLDVNRACVSTTVDNVARNNLSVSKVETLCADLATVVVERPWDVVVCNPPHFPHDPLYVGDDGLQAALVGGVDGRALYDALLARLDELLAPHGTVVLAHSSLADIPRTRAELAAVGYDTRTVQICELDIPLRRFAAHRILLLARLYRLRAANRAAFTGLRFEVHTLIAARTGDRSEGELS